MDVSRSLLVPLISGILAAVALAMGVAYFARSFAAHNALVVTPTATTGPAALTIAEADAALQRGDRKAALSQAQAAVNLAPLDATVVQRAGQIARDAGDLRAAQQDFTLAEIAAPRNAASYVALSDIFVREGKPRAAEAPLRFGLVRNPHAPMLHYNLALLELSRGDERDAVNDFRAEPKTSPVYGAAQIGIAMTPDRAVAAATPEAAPTQIAARPAYVAPVPVERTAPPVIPVPVLRATPMPPPPPVATVAPPPPTHRPIAPPAVRPLPVVHHVVPPPVLRTAAPVVRTAATLVSHPAVVASPTPTPRAVVAMRPVRRSTPTRAPVWVPVPRPYVPRELVPVSTITAPPPASSKLRPVETVTAAPPGALPTLAPTPISTETP
jgi:hypothetical protein